MERGNHCPHCKAPLETGIQFCTSCGQQVPPSPLRVCRQCGNDFDAGSKFCTHCGASQTVEPPGIPPAVVPAEEMRLPPTVPPPARPHRPARSAARPSLLRYALILGLLFIALGTIWYFLFGEPRSFGFAKSKGEVLLRARITTLHETLTLQVGDELQLVLPLGLFDGKQSLVVTRMEPEAGSGFDRLYDISLGKLHLLDGYLEISMATALISPQSDQAILGWTYHDNAWQPIPAWHDASGDRVRFYTNHLSLFAFGLAPPVSDEVLPAKEVDPGMVRMGIENNQSQQALQLLTQPGNLDLQKALGFSWEVLRPAFSIRASDRQRDPYRTPLIVQDPLVYPFGLALSEIVGDRNSAPTPAPFTGDAMRNYNRLPAKVREAAPMQDLFTALFALEYAHEEVTPVSRYDLGPVYQPYATGKGSRGGRTMASWKRQLDNSLRNLSDPGAFGAATNHFLTDQFQEFWGNPDTRGQVVRHLKGRGDIAVDELPDHWQVAVQEDFVHYMRGYLHPVLEEVQRGLAVKARVALQQQAEAMRQDFNRRHHIHCRMELNAVQKTINYAGSRIVFDVPAAYREKWQGTMAANETFDFYFTTAGYIEAGMPTRATLYLEQKNEREQITVNFELKEGVTELVFKPDDFNPVWGGRPIDLKSEMEKTRRELDQIYRQLNR